MCGPSLQSTLSPEAAKGHLTGRIETGRPTDNRKKAATRGGRRSIFAASISEIRRHCVRLLRTMYLPAAGLPQQPPFRQAVPETSALDGWRAHLFGNFYRG